jgi:hypothetical protein
MLLPGPPAPGAPDNSARAAGPQPRGHHDEGGLIRFLYTFFLVTPFFSAGPKLSTAQIAFLAPATLVLIVAVNRWVVGRAASRPPAVWPGSVPSCAPPAP